MPRFVILEHDHPERHWDLMLERGPVLWTWRLPSTPRLGSSMRGERTFDHRLIYLEYEGPISGDRGAVARWDRGTFSWELETDSRIRVRLDGGKTRGVLRLHLLDGVDWDVQLVAEGGTPGVGEG